MISGAKIKSIVQNAARSVCESGAPDANQHNEKTIEHAIVEALRLTGESPPENPYPIEVFTMTMEQYIAAVPDENLRTAISGCIGRHVWDACCREWQR